MNFQSGDKRIESITDSVKRYYSVGSLHKLFDSGWQQNRIGDGYSRWIHWSHPTNKQKMIVASVMSDGSGQSYEARNMHA